MENLKNEKKLPNYIYLNYKALARALIFNLRFKEHLKS